MRFGVQVVNIRNDNGMKNGKTNIISVKLFSMKFNLGVQKCFIDYNQYFNCDHIDPEKYNHAD